MARPAGIAADQFAPLGIETQTLAAEREKASFNVELMAALWLGGEKQVAARRKSIARLSEYPLYNKQDQYQNSKYERYIRMCERATTFIQQRESGVFNDLSKLERVHIASMVIRDDPVGIHLGMFMPTIRLQASQEQQAKWLPAAEGYSILGTYCQTELGHGSDVAGLETTATFDKEAQEFEIHTPTVRATKWWPQGLGRTVTHGVVYARLLLPQTSGKLEDKGVRAFLVQLRDLKTHENLPGICSGDIGPTLGVVDCEQGWCTFDRVRVPRVAMLCRYGEVLPDGSFVAHGSSGTEKRGYSTMMKVRSEFAHGSSDYLARGCAIAIRYCAVRRQFPDSKIPGTDAQVLDYQGVQFRTLPWIAAAYALRFTGNKMMKIYEQSEARVAQHDDLSGVAEAHALSSGLKATLTKMAADGIEELRRACGGHGYLQFSGLGELYANMMLMFTGEGENYMIIQQLTRWLLKGDFHGGSGWAAFLADGGARVPRCSVQEAKEWLDVAAQVAALQQRARCHVAGISVRVKAAEAAGKSGTEAARSVQWDGIQAAFAVGEALIADAFAEGIAQAETSLQPILKRLCGLFCLSLLERNLADLLMDGYMLPAQAEALRVQARELLEAVRPDAVPLVDSFCFSDLELNSALGAYDGDVYKRLLDWASKEPMNQGAVIKGWQETWGALLQDRRHKLEESSGLTLADRGLDMRPEAVPASRL